MVLLHPPTRKFILAISGGVNMVTGLTFEQLFQTFFKAFLNRQNQSKTEKLMVNEGLNPAAEKIISEFKEKYPDINLEQWQLLLNFISALLDCIILNNEELLKSIPHVDV
jgi:hypothetical protein